MILFTHFQTKGALEERWKQVQGAVERIAGAASRHYENQFRQFIPQLTALIAANPSQFINASGALVINQTNLNFWQSQGINPPSFASINMNTVAGRTALGVDDEIRLITDAPTSGGSGLQLAFTVGRLTPAAVTIYSTLPLLITTVPWGQWENSGTGRTPLR